MTEAGSAGVWRREGDGWVVGLDGRRAHVRDAKGMQHIAALLAAPGRSIPALELVAAAENRPAGARGADAEGLSVGGLGDAGPVLDEQAKRQYRERLRELQEELEEAERFNDPERVVRAREELEFLTRELSSAIGLGGRDRLVGAAAERARVNVTRAIRTAIDRMEPLDPPLAEHLRASLRTGTACSYEPAAAVRWELREPPAVATGTAELAVLVSDIEDSSAMLERLGDDRWLELLAIHNGIVRAQVARHGGREVKSSGDGFLLTFGEVRAALWCAIDVQRELARHNESEPERPLRVRMGLHAGEAVQEGGDVFGRTVVIAARVGAMAAGGQVLVTEEVTRQAEGTLGELSFGPPRDVSFKGLRGTHRVHEVLWGQEAVRARERPVAGVPGIVEREVELAVLEAALGRAAEGTGSVLLFEGPAGIGKSTLLSALSADAATRGFRVLRARGSELERGFPFGIARQLFDAPLHALTPERREALLRGAVLPAAAMLGHAPMPERVDEAATFAVLNGLFWLCAGFAEEHPVVVIVDDAQWADEQTLAWLEFLVPRASDLPLVVAVAERPTGWGEGALDRLREASGVLVIAPGALSEAAVADVVRATWPETEVAFCRACHAASAGNPFYLREIVAAARAAGVEPTARGAERLRDVTPASVTRLVAGRLRRLTEDARTLARACAVLGPRSELGLAARLCGLDPAAAFAAADELGAAEILRPGHPLEFAHPLVQAAVEHEIPPGARAVLHEEAARLLEERGAAARDIAAHLLYASPAGRAAAAERLLVAARQALGEGATAHAVDLLERALAEPPPASLVPAVRLELGRSLTAAGREGEAAAHLEAALDLAPDSRFAAEVLLELSRPYVGGAIGDRMAQIDAAIAALAPEDAELRWALEARALELLGYAIFAAPNPALEREHLDRLDRVPQTASGPTPGERQLRAIYAVHSAIRGRISAERAHEIAVRALDDGSLMRRLAEGAWTCDSAIEVLDLVDAFDMGDRHAREAEQHARRRGAVAAEAFACMLRAMLALHRGALAEAESLLRSVFAATREVRMPYVSYQAQQIRACVAIERGDLALAGRACEALAQLEVSPIGPPHARGRLHAARGEHLLAVPELRAVVEMQRSTGIWRGMIMGSGRADLALSLVAAGEGEEALALAEAELEVARAFGAGSAVASALRVHAHALGGELAPLQEAAAVLAGSQALFLRARVLCDLGTAQRARGDVPGARVNLRAGLELAGRCGAHRLAVEARRELEAAGERVRSRPVAVADRLTPGERRVAELAVEGVSDVEIAQSLFLTVRAVEDQLTTVAEKLHVGDRSQLAAALTAA